VVSASLPPRIIEKRLASDRIVIDTVVSKYCNHTPLHRQSVILKRDSGLEISRATLDGWVLKVGELLIPMVAAMRRELISGTYIQADETPVDVQMHEGRGKNHQAYLWQYGRPAGTVVFDFCLGRGRDGPKHFLGQFEGILQTDGYTAYDQIGGTRMVHAACWAHARRQFFDAVQLNPRDPVATPIVARMDELFAVDAEARRRVIGLTRRHALRQERAKPLLDDIRSKIEVAPSIALSSSALSKADAATRRKIRRALQERAECMDRVRRAAALMTIQEVGRWERACARIDSAFAGQPWLPNEAPDSPRNRARSSAFFKAHKQASQNMGSAVVFVALCGSEPADESGWLRIMEAFKNK